MDRTSPGPAAASGLRIFATREREALSPAVMALLLERAEIMHEGGLAGEGDTRRWFGTLLFSVDIACIADMLKDPATPETADRILRHMRADAVLRTLLVRMARREALRRAGDLPLTPLRASFSGRTEGTRILVDIDVEMDGIPTRDLDLDRVGG